MKKLTIQLFKPSFSTVELDHISTDKVHTYTSFISSSALTKGKKNIPIMPKLHAQAILDLARIGIQSKNYQLLPIATYLGLHLNKESTSIIKLRVEDIQADLGLSSKSITKTIALLASLGYIEVIAQSTYYIKPKLAFYGSLINWSIALQAEEEGKTLEEIHSLQREIENQIEENVVQSITNLTNKIVKKPETYIDN
jgi:hypothetical protein